VKWALSGVTAAAKNSRSITIPRLWTQPWLIAKLIGSKGSWLRSTSANASIQTESSYPNSNELYFASINLDRDAAQKGHVFPAGRERDGGVVVSVVNTFALRQSSSEHWHEASEPWFSGNSPTLSQPREIMGYPTVGNQI
jgi:hypothetical protein